MIKVMFFGSSLFSVESLIKIAENKNFQIVGIVTGKAKKVGKKQVLTDNIVKQKALELGIDTNIIFEIENLKSDDLFEKISNIPFDIGVVVSFGYLIPTRYINLPKIDMINLHPSSLPLFRGASPIQKTIQSGANFIDICIIKIVPKMDEGDILLKEKQEINFTDHASDLIPLISKKGAILIEKGVEYLFQNKDNLQKIYTPQKGDAVYAHKIKQEELLINFNETGEEVYNKIRANNMDGGMYFLHKDIPIKILKAEFIVNSYEQNDLNQTYGLEKDNKSNFFLNLKGGKIKPLILQQAGKRAMSYDDFFRGFKF